ncbi:Spo0B domain-containing protein [Selenihalanaerobacter shriftii]|uniref:Sensor_kinase_SpoOB-type, alpha-helical domain n=1 Tax=Selenihalanaerobacter shriftii TaxID=142842 RepID=A0A1T4LAJ2_9FIRM|nr:Spo0B domain-containing protein [Selenihalanaerobacter shriftii]SJZ51527.1 Sensor_kinase_SpoOB-type, alpha-helical domain [Selenihalanaerobacter shriftii]
MFTVIEHQDKNLIEKIDYIKIIAILMMFVITYLHGTSSNFNFSLSVGAFLIISIISVLITFKIKNSVIQIDAYHKWAFLELIIDAILITVFIYLDYAMANFFQVIYILYIFRIGLKYGKDLAYLAAVLCGVAAMGCQANMSNQSFFWLPVFGLVVAKFIGELAENEYLLRQGKEEMINQLRVQRHDFKNQLQVLWGLVQLEKYDRIIDYLKKLMKH